MTVTRRTVLGAPIVASLASIGEALGAPSRLDCVVVENGTLSQAGYTVSMISSSQMPEEIANFRQAHVTTGYRRRNFGFRSTDRWKIPYFTAALDYFVSSPNLMAHTVRVEAFNGWHERSPTARRAIYFAIYRRLFETIPASQRGTVSAHLWKRSTDSRDQALLASLQNNLGAGSQAALDGGQFFDVMKLAEVLFGSIKLSLDSQGTAAQISKTKLEIMRIIRQSIGLTDLSYSTLARSAKFKAVLANY